MPNQSTEREKKKSDGEAEKEYNLKIMNFQN